MSTGITTQVQWRRGTKAQNDVFAGASGEITVDTDNNQIRVHDGNGTIGGWAGARIVDLNNSINSLSGYVFGHNITGGSFTLGNQPFYINTGISGISWTLPLISQTINTIYKIKNKSYPLIITGSSSDSIFLYTRVPSFVINSGEGYTLLNDSVDWVVI